jgi:hypothetical protein
MSHNRTSWEGYDATQEMQNFYACLIANNVSRGNMTNAGWWVTEFNDYRDRMRGILDEWRNAE